jgi:hypothetical protein
LSFLRNKSFVIKNNLISGINKSNCGFIILTRGLLKF